MIFEGRKRDKKLLLQRHLLPEIDVDGFDIGVADEGVKLSASRRFRVRHRTYFINAYSPSSRPTPDCLYPPNGTFTFSVLTQLTHAVPASSLCANSIAFVMSLVNTAAARP